MSKPLLEEHLRHAKEKKFLIRHSQLHLGEQIGRGSFGEVYQGTWKETKVAVKKMVCSADNVGVVERFSAEVEMLSSLRHPNVVHFYASTVRMANNGMIYLYIVTELCEKGSLDMLLMKNPTTKYGFEEKISFAIDTVLGMIYLHSIGLIHRDLKIQNLLVDKDFTVKVGDFGLSRFSLQKEEVMTRCGTFHILAPEVISHKRYSSKADVYAFAMVLWEMMMEKPAYANEDSYDVLNKVVLLNLRPPLNEMNPPEIAALISDCWETNPNSRPEFESILPRLKNMKKQQQ